MIQTAEQYIQEMLGEPKTGDNMYAISPKTLALLLRTYGKSIVIECAGKAVCEYDDNVSMMATVKIHEIDRNSIITVMKSI